MANITKSFVEKQATARADGKQALYFDDQLKGFGVRVTSGSKTFILDRKQLGKTVRLSIGRFPDWSVQQARDRARELIVEMDKGLDVREKFRRKDATDTTLQQVFDRFLTERTLKPRTRIDYERYMRSYFHDWLPLPVKKIDAAMVMNRYKKIAASSSGAAQASSAMRCLRSVLNFGAATFDAGELGPNPVLSLTAKRVWLRDRAKTDHLRVHEVGTFVLALRRLPNPSMSGYLEFILRTGARRSEAAQLKWTDLDFGAKTVVFRDTKNHSDRVIPMTPEIARILERQRVTTRSGDYVFSSTTKTGEPTFIKEPRKAMSRANTEAKSKVTVHGLRRTFCTLLESLDCPAYPLKALMGHSVRNDVTAAHYNQISVDRLRSWMERYEAHMQSLIAQVASTQEKPAVA